MDFRRNWSLHKSQFYLKYIDQLVRQMTNIPFIMLADKNSGEPLYRQIYDTIRKTILNGELKAGTQLPATRQLSEQLGVSRMTVVNAYEQLFAEGYLEGKIGAGTFVASQLPEELLQSPVGSKKTGDMIEEKRVLKLSEYGKRVSKFNFCDVLPQTAGKPVPFQNGLTAIEEFPFEIWSKIAAKFYRQPPSRFLGYGEPAGYRPLRNAIVEHLASARGVNCTVEQVIITNGAQQALDLISRVLLDSSDKVWIEEPGYPEARDVFSAVGAEVVSVPVDDEGLNFSGLEEENLAARLVYVTPSHQYPLGVTMSLARRLKLLEWACLNNALIIEDDYNSEYRYQGRPLASLQGLDREGRVIYVGTFSKTIFPALRLGCMVVPRDLIEIFSLARVLGDWHSPLFEQAILSEFIAEGHFARHLRRMRSLYEKRQQALVEEVKKQLAGKILIEKSDAGMHLIGWLPEDVSDREISKKAFEIGLNVKAVSAYCRGGQKRNGLMLGYTAFNEKQIREGVRKLASIL